MTGTAHHRQNILALIGVWAAFFAVGQAPLGSADRAAPPSQEFIGAADQSLPALPDGPKEATLLFGGDVMLARTVEQKMLKLGDFAAPFSAIADVFKNADLSFANLESPFFDGGSATPNGGFSFRALPGAIEGMERAGIDTVSLANNHMLNQGQAGLRFTMAHLKEHGIAFAGAGENEEAARQGAVVPADDLLIGFLAYAYPEDGTVATASRPGILAMDIQKMPEDVRRLRASADLVVVSMHAGSEYVFRSGEKQRAFAHAAIDAGASIVVGHHPHVIQEFERYKDGLIFYSLGNLVFDQEWSVPTTEGLVARVTLTDARPSQVDFLPVKIEDYHRPRFMSEEEGKPLLGKIGVEGFSIHLPNPSL